MIKRILEDIRCVRARDPAMRSQFDGLTFYPGLHAVWAHRVAHRLWLWRIYWFARLISQIARWATGIEIHPGARIGRRLFIDHGMGVVIGETAEIGDDCTLYHGVTLGGTSWQAGKRHPTLGTGVVVGAGAKILGPISVGNNARIGSNAVVVKEVDEGATVVGVPGRVVVKKNAHLVTTGISRQHDPEGSINNEFDAYAQPANAADPMAQTLDRLVGKLDRLDQRVVELSIETGHLRQQVRGLGGEILEVEAGYTAKESGHR